MNEDGYSNRIRVAIWGAGAIARCLVREALRRHEIELVGVLARDPAKDGQDVGSLFGDSPTGVLVTTSRDAILALRPDIVLHAARTTDAVELGSEMVNEVCGVLAAGISIVSSAAFHYPNYSTPGVADALETSCQEGGSAIHSTGINPGLLCERWVVGLTAGMTKISSITVREIADVSAIPSKGMMQHLGIGAPPATVQAKPAGNSQRYFGEAVAGACNQIGYVVERVEHQCVATPAKKTIDLPSITVQVGQTAGIIHRYTGFVDGRPFFTLEQHLFVDPAACVVELEGNPYLATAAIEAEPTSVSMRVNLKASVVEDRAVREDGTRGTANTTAAAMLNAIPEVLGGAVGVIYSRAFAVHKVDLRTGLSRVQTETRPRAL